MRISKNLISRALTGIVFISVMLVCIFAGKYTYALIFCLIQALALWEFYDLIEKGYSIKLSKIGNIAGGVLLFAGSFVYFTGLVSSPIVFLPYICYFLLLFISELFLKRKDPILSLAGSVLGQIYLAVPFSILNHIVFSYDLSQHCSYIFVLLIFIWVNDSFAYLSGVAFGKHKMFKRISPKKSWEGFAGGAICTIGSSLVFAHFFPGMGVIGWIGLSVTVIVFGTLGDLIESLMKRTLNIKDSGTIFPGHGGILDRFDSLIMAIPAVAIYLAIIYYFTGI